LKNAQNACKRLEYLNPNKLLLHYRTLLGRLAAVLALSLDKSLFAHIIYNRDGNLTVFKENFMKKMGKILIFAVIFGVLSAFTAFAQNAAQLPAQEEWTKPDLQSIYMEHLRNEGYVPSIDIDGDIQFKVSGDNYFIIIDENDVKFFQIYMGFSLGSIETEAAINAANLSNRRSKVAKISISPDGNIASITIEMILNDPRDFVPVFARTLSLIRNAEGIFRAQLKDMSIAGKSGSDYSSYDSDAM